MTTEQQIKKLSIEEKSALMRGIGNWKSKNNKTIDLCSLTFSDGPIGIRKELENSNYLQQSIIAVCFPSGALLGQTFNPNIVNLVAAEIGKEARYYDIDILLGPAMNIKRNPLGGRNFEYYSEDPYLTAELAKAYVIGLEDQGVGACLKHFCAYSQETNRMTINAVIDDRTLHEIYLSAFEDVILATNPASIMTSYNMVNGVHMSENKALLSDYLRKKLNYNGLIISDWYAVSNPVNSLLSGLDLEMPQSNEINYEKVYEAITKDKSVEISCDQAILYLKQTSDKFHKEHKHVDLNFEDGHEIAKQAALEGIVLLKNDNHILPIHDLKDVLLIGELATTPHIQGGGSSHINTYKSTSFLELTSDLDYIRGYNLQNENDNTHLQQAIDKAKHYKSVIVFLGYNDLEECESIDKTDISLPKNQLKLIEELTKLDIKIIVIIETGSVCEIPFINEVDAVFYTSLGGEAVNDALYDLILGNKNPCGHLAETFPLKLKDNPSYEYFPGDGSNVLYKEALYVGYRYYQTFDVPVLFPFGYGLSYSNFQLKACSLLEDEDITVKVIIKNTSSIPGKACVQIYMSKPNDHIYNPKKELIAFSKPFLQAYEEKEIILPIDKRKLSYFDIESNRYLPLYGEYTFTIGFDSSDDSFKLKYSFNNSHITTKTSLYNINNIHKINDELFQTLFNKKMPIVKKTKPFDIETTLTEAKSKGSKGARLFIAIISKIKSIKENKIYYNTILNSPIRVLIYNMPVLAKNNSKVFLNVLNDHHYIWNLLKLLLSMAKYASKSL